MSKKKLYNVGDQVVMVRPEYHTDPPKGMVLTVIYVLRPWTRGIQVTCPKFNHQLDLDQVQKASEFFKK